MAPALERRFYCNSYYDDCNNSEWSDWGRWIVVVGVIVAALIVFFLISCFTARRRRKNGLQPFYGTGWTAGRTPLGHSQPQYYGNNNNTAATPSYGPGYQPQQESYYGNTGAAPAYSPPAQEYGQQWNSQHANNLELQQPQQAYSPYQQTGEAYGPPPGSPPPKKGGDGIIR